MAVITVVSAKHAPGATTTAMLLASAADPFCLPLVLEADPAGGDLAARVGTLFEPGMSTLVRAARSARGPGLIEQHCRPLPSGVGLIVGAMHPAQIAIYGDDAPGLLIEPLRARGGLAVIDAGRWGSPSSRSWVLGSDAVVLVLRPTVESAEHVALRLGELDDTGVAVALAVVGDGPLRVDDVAAIVERPVHELPADPDTARALCGAQTSSEELRATPLFLAAEKLLLAVL